MERFLPKVVKVGNLEECVVLKTLIQYVSDYGDIPKDKGCLIEVLNKDSLIRAKGIETYHYGVVRIANICMKEIDSMGFSNEITLYMIDQGMFYISTNGYVSAERFKFIINKLFEKFHFYKDVESGIAALVRFILIVDRKNPLQTAYDLMVANKDSGVLFLSSEDLIDKKLNGKEDLEVIEFLYESIKNDCIVPYYQGIRDNVSGKIEKYEALMRIKDEEGNIYPPSYFMDIAKKYHLYLALSARMITKVIEDFDGRDEEVSVNISYADIFDETFRNWLIGKLNTVSNPENFTIEITETDNDALGTDVDTLIDHCRKLGMKIAIDDYGTGYSTLARIVDLKPDYIKIDGSIVEKIFLDEKYKTMLESVTLMAKGCKAKVIAEFVKNVNIQNEIEKIGIEYSQGYYYSMPAPFDNIKRSI